MSAEHGPERRRLLSRIFGDGLEIGAGNKPLPLPGGASVTYVDAWTEPVLLRYHHEIESTGSLTPAGIIARAEALPVASASQDFVLTSHVLEHLEDPIAGLLEWHRVLKPGGLLFLCLPDKRNTFDAPRARTTLAHLLLDHADDRASRSDRDLEHYREWARYVNDLTDPRQADFWGRLLQRIGYPIHFHCWEAEDLRELIAHLGSTAESRFDVLDEAPRPDGYEFSFLLKKPGG